VNPFSIPALLPCRHRSADVLFAGAAAQAAAQGTVVPILPPRLAHINPATTAAGPWAASITSEAGAPVGVQDFSGHLIALPPMDGPPGSAGGTMTVSIRTPTGSAGGVGLSVIPEGTVVSGGGGGMGGVGSARAGNGNSKAGALHALADGQLARDALGATVSALQGLPNQQRHIDPGAAALGATVATFSAAATSPGGGYNSLTAGSTNIFTAMAGTEQPFSDPLYATGSSGSSGDPASPSVSAMARAKAPVGHAAAAAVASVAAAVKSLAPSVQGAGAVPPIHIASPSMQMVGGTAGSGTSPRVRYDSTPVRPRVISPPRLHPGMAPPGTEAVHGADPSHMGPTVLLDLAQQYHPPVVLQPSPRQPAGYVPSNLGYVPTALLQQSQPQQIPGGQDGSLVDASQQGSFTALQGQSFSSTGGRGRSRSPGAGGSVTW
jgi:hypothetical protein